MAAASVEYKESYSVSATTETKSESRCCNSNVIFDKRYLTGIPGIIKYVEIVSLFGFILGA